MLATMRYIGDRLANLRKINTISRNELAKKVNVTERAIEYYEKNQRVPRANVLVAIADYFNVSVDWLLGREQKA